MCPICKNREWLNFVEDFDGNFWEMLFYYKAYNAGGPFNPIALTKYKGEIEAVREDSLAIIDICTKCGLVVS